MKEWRGQYESNREMKKERNRWEKKKIEAKETERDELGVKGRGKEER